MGSQKKCAGSGLTFQKAGQMSYFELEKAKVCPDRSPLSVHFPLNMPYSDALIYEDCAFNIFSLAVPPDMKSGSVTCTAIREKNPVPMVSFLFDDPPFIPEFRQTSWHRPEGGYPMATGSFTAWSQEYEVSSCLDVLSGKMYIKVTVANHSETPKQAVVRLLQSRTMEQSFMEYHYWSYRWDAERFSQLLPDRENSPRIVDAGRFQVTENDSFSFEDSQYGKNFSCGRPYTVSPFMRVRQGENFTKFSCELLPGEKASFTAAVSFGKDDETAGEYADFETVCERSRIYWDSLLKDGNCFYGDQRRSDIFRALQWGSLQLLLDLDSPTLGRICQPCQGGTSERFFVWVWEAMCSLRPMLKLGHFEPVRKVIDFIFKLQDGGCPPQGKFKSLEGAIGTTGPRWANATGSALVLASEYALLSGDQEFVREYLGRMIRAADWILNEVKGTRVYEEDGSKRLGFGVMPLCCATDGDYGYILASTDLWSLAGVEAFVLLLKALDDPSYSRIAAECAQYRRDFSDAVDLVRREDGFIDRKLCDEGRIAKEFTVSAGAVKFLNTFADPREERFRKFIRYSEEHLFSGRFCGPVFDRINYIGNSESNMFISYLKLGEWKKAHLAFSVFSSCGMSQDLFLTQERFSEVDECFVPWQPNASNNGRYLQMMIDSLFLECPDDEIILCGGVTPESLLKKEKYFLKDLHTACGIVSLHLEEGVLTVMRSRPFEAGTCFRLPDYISFGCESGALADRGENHFEVKTPVLSFSGKVQVDLQKLI